MRSERFIEGARKCLGSKKCDAYEIYCLEKDHLLADAREGKTESLEDATEVGIAVRVINGHRLGFSYTNSLDFKRIEDCIDMAIEGGRDVDPDDAWHFALPEVAPEFEWKYNDDKLAGIKVADKVRAAIRLEAAALGVDPRVKKVRRAIYDESRIKIHLLNSEGADLRFEKTLVSCEIMVVAESDEGGQWSWDLGFSHTFDGLDVESVGKNAAKQVIALLGARRIPTVKTPACLHPFVAAQFLNALTKGFHGDNIYKKKSTLVEKTGKLMYSKVLNITNDGLLKDGYGSLPFDGEGEPHKKFYLVKKGVIKNWLTDIYWGRKIGIPSTGSSVRSSLKELPTIAVSNVYVEPAEAGQEALFNQMGSGFFITSIIGGHTINPITGDFSVGAEGEWIENGTVKYPVKGVIVAGNLHDLFRNVVAVGSDIRFMANVGSPTLMVSEIQVSGQ